MSKKYTRLILFFKLYINFLLCLQLFIDVKTYKYLFRVILSFAFRDMCRVKNNHIRIKEAIHKDKKLQLSY